MSTASRALTSVTAQEANARTAYSRQPTEGNRLKWKRWKWILSACREKKEREEAEHETAL